MKKNKKKIFVICFSFFLSFFLFTLFVHAADTQVANAKYVPLAPIYTPDNVQVGAQGDIGSYFSEMYQLGVGIATALAVLMVIWGGVEYVTTDAIGGKEEGKQKVQNAILGLLLALGSYLILQTINPKLLETNLTIDKIDTAGITVKTGALPSGADGAGSSGNGNNGQSGGGGWGGDGSGNSGNGGNNNSGGTNANGGDGSTNHANAWSNWTWGDQGNLDGAYSAVAQYNIMHGTNLDPMSLSPSDLAGLSSSDGSPLLTQDQIKSVAIAINDTYNQQAINNTTPTTGGGSDNPSGTTGGAAGVNPIPGDGGTSLTNTLPATGNSTFKTVNDVVSAIKNNYTAVPSEEGQTNIKNGDYVVVTDTTLTATPTTKFGQVTGGSITLYKDLSEKPDSQSTYTVASLINAAKNDSSIKVDAYRPKPATTQTTTP